MSKIFTSIMVSLVSIFPFEETAVSVVILLPQRANRDQEQYRYNNTEHGNRQVMTEY